MNVSILFFYFLKVKFFSLFFNDLSLLFRISLSTLVCNRNFSPFKNFSGTDIFLNLAILLLLFIIFAYKILRSVIIMDLSFNFTIGRMLGGRTGKYFIISQLGSVLVCRK